MDFKVSVIIPVLNGEKYIERAIESAISLDSVVEVIVIDDGSTDSSLDICKRLATKYSKIIVLTHKGNINKGVSASRNLGIKVIKSEFVAFLDADDFYLPNRFETEKELFSQYANFDGAYGATKIINNLDNTDELYTYSQAVAPQQLFNALLWENYGHFHISTLTIKKNIIDSIGGFDEKMSVAEDSDFYYRIAEIANIYSGSITVPISIRNIHGDNTMIKSESKYPYFRQYLYKKMLKHFLFSSHTTFTNKSELLLMLNHHQRIFNKVFDEKKFLWKLSIKYPFLFFCPFLYHKCLQLVKKDRLIYINHSKCHAQIHHYYHLS